MNFSSASIYLDKKFSHPPVEHADFPVQRVSLRRVLEQYSWAQISPTGTPGRFSKERHHNIWRYPVVRGVYRPHSKESKSGRCVVGFRNRSENTRQSMRGSSPIERLDQGLEGQWGPAVRGTGSQESHRHSRVASVALQWTSPARSGRQCTSGCLHEEGY